MVCIELYRGKHGNFVASHSYPLISLSVSASLSFSLLVSLLFLCYISAAFSCCVGGRDEGADRRRVMESSGRGVG